MTDQTGPSRRAGLRDEIVEALGRITTVPPVAHRREQADHVLAVLYRAWPWLRAEAEEEATDRATFRDRIAAALYEAEYPGFDWRQAHSVDWEQSLKRADAALSVLPAPADPAAVTCSGPAVGAQQSKEA